MAAPGEFIAYLLHARTAAHFLHLQVRGPGSFAAHKALNEVYDALPGLVDSVAEAWIGLNTVIKNYPNNFVASGADPVTFVRRVYDYVEKNRSCMGTASHIQNDIDNISGMLASALYKLENLA